jgi:D-beta-D-heptose 7-phosphate kinase/D-beta-D-heptose 1-phosphate adenosyltransferase
MDIAQRFLKRQREKRLRVAVIGDIMLDEFYEGRVSRVSPEAPVPVFLTPTPRPTKVVPGGAANVALQLRNMNVEVVLFSIMDAEARAYCNNYGIKTEGPATHTLSPRKRRFFDTQALLRWDVEDDPEYSYADQLKPLLKTFAASGKFDVAILSDYAKGLFQPDFTKELLNLCRWKETLTVVDPKKQPISKWEGCTVFKPNASEATKFCDSTQPLAQAEELSKLLGSRVVITRGAEGPVIYDGTEAVRRTEIFAFNPVSASAAIYGYSGAGDCFAAIMSQAFGLGFNLTEACKIGYRAGAKYVLGDHNSPIHPLDLSDNKYVEPEDLANRDFKLVITNGCFDIIHVGHLHTFKFAKTKGDKLAVLINTDESVRGLKGPDRPINTLEHRKEMLAALDCVDYVVDFNEDSPYNTISKIKPDVLVKGGDYVVEQIRSAKLVPETYIAPLIEGVSTTKIAEKNK